LREIVKKAPPLPAAKPTFPAEPPWSTGLAELAHLWLSIRCECRAGGALPLRYLAAAHGWKMPLSDVVGRLKCTNCGQRPSSVELVDNATTGATGVPESGTKHRRRLI